MPQVSVVIPTYNRANLISRSIMSVLSQTYQDFEIIVVDDASTDGTKDVVKSFADSRIRYLRNKKNRGPSIARNIGIHKSVGKTIAFLDSDDEWKSMKLEKQIEYSKKRSYKTDWIGYTQFTVVGNATSYITPERGKNPEEHISDYLFVNHGIILTSSIILPKRTALRCNFTPGLQLHQDADLCLRLGSIGAQFIFIQEPLWCWHNDSRQDRIVASHDVLKRLQWMQTCIDLFTPKARKHFINSHIIKLLCTQEQSEETAAIIVEMMKTGFLEPREGLTHLKKILCHG